MKLTLEKLNEYIEMFALRVLAPNAPDNNIRLKIGVAKGWKLLRVSPKYVKILKDHGVIDDAGNVDIELLKDGIFGGLETASDIPIEELGITLGRPDFDKFFRLCETGAIS